MPAFIDFSNKKIGRVNIESFFDTKGGRTRWNCQCDCGKKFISYNLSFKRGDTFECKDCRLERKRGIDLTGRKYGRWTVIRRTIDKRNKTQWIVKCDCGNEGVVSTSALGKKGKSESCGCLGRKRKSKWVNETLYPPKHLVSKTKLYSIRIRFTHACYNPKSVGYKLYGAKGYTVCELWRNGAKDFCEWCRKNDWQEGDTIQIKEGSKIFGPETCYLIPRGDHVSSFNSKKIEFESENKTIKEWEKCSDVKKRTILWRMRHGYNIKDAIKKKKHENSGPKIQWDENELRNFYESGMNCRIIGEKLGHHYATISKKLKSMGYNIEHNCDKRIFKIKICELCKKEYNPTSSKQRKCLDCK